MKLLRQASRAIISRLFLRVPVAREGWRQATYASNSFADRPESLALDFGCGKRPRNPFQCASFQGVDIVPGDNIVFADFAAGALPFESDLADVITAFDLLEHIPRVLAGREDGQGVRFPLVDLLNEIHRVLKPGGLFFSSTPCFPWPMAFQDPTHVNIMTEDTLNHYFCGPSAGASMYGFRGSFQMRHLTWVGGHVNALMVKS